MIQTSKICSQHFQRKAEGQPAANASTVTVNGMKNHNKVIF